MNSKITTTSLTPLLDSTVVTPKSPLSPQIPIHIEHHYNGSSSSQHYEYPPSSKPTSSQLPTTQFLFPNNNNNTATNHHHQQNHHNQYNASSRSSYPEILRPRLSLNGTMTPFRYLSISPRPLLRDSNSKSTQPLTMSSTTTANDETTTAFGTTMMMANFTATANNHRRNTSANTNRIQSNVQSSSYGAFDDSNNPVYSINSNNMNMVENLGSLRRFSIDRHSFLGKLVQFNCVGWLLLFVDDCLFHSIDVNGISKTFGFGLIKLSFFGFFLLFFIVYWE